MVARARCGYLGYAAAAQIPSCGLTPHTLRTVVAEESRVTTLLVVLHASSVTPLSTIVCRTMFKQTKCVTDSTAHSRSRLPCFGVGGYRFGDTGFDVFPGIAIATTEPVAAHALA